MWLFRKRRGIRLPYKKQGLIYFICININELSPEFRQKITDLCDEVAGENSKALYEVITDDSRTVEAIARQHYMSATTLYNYRKEFNEKWKSVITGRLTIV